MWELLLDFLFPRRSLTGVEGGWVTADECKQLRSEPVVLGARELRALGLTALDRVVAATDYRASPLMHRAVQIFKYRRVRGLGEALGAILAEASRLSWSDEPPVLCPVPLHWTRRFERGFNQSEMLARIVANERGVEVKPLLRRVRPTGHQVGRTKSERLIAVTDAFAAIEARMPAFVVLIDDLSTTGATLEQCAIALKKAGAKRVEGLVVAHG